MRTKTEICKDHLKCDQMCYLAIGSTERYK